ncbi:MAG: phosphate ABC transporter, permease protein PstA, partial [Clostridia bacterium]|nr:phosphate ABC transporter, permease protein PstA [Clostridia bacterium]
MADVCKRLPLLKHLRHYRRHPGSFLLMLLVSLAALITILTLLFLIVYILVRGVPHLKPSLFAWEYNSENVSLTPALINTVSLTLLTLLFAVPVGVGSAIYLAEYA